MRALALVRDIPLREHAPLSEYTSFRIGGPADLLFAPRTTAELVRLIRWSGDTGFPLVMGRGTNLLVSDAGVRGAVIQTTALNLEDWHLAGNCLTAPAGLPLSRLTVRCAKEGLSGLTFAYGIPGTLGGALTMNAGAYGGEMRDVVLRSRFLDSAGAIREHCGERHAFGYRDSVYAQTPGQIVLDATLRLRPDDPAALAADMSALLRRRNEKQPVDKPSAGSIFKRPPGYHASALIDQCGLKGFSVGAAQVSEKHAGFIVNQGGATCEDVRRLIAHIQQTVFVRFGVELEPEVRLVGEY